MPTPIIQEVWEALETKSAHDFTNGYSGLDMSLAIYKGRFVEAPAIPSVYIGFISSTQQNGTTLTRYQGDLVFQLYCLQVVQTTMTEQRRPFNLVQIYTTEYLKIELWD